MCTYLTPKAISIVDTMCGDILFVQQSEMSVELPHIMQPPNDMVIFLRLF